MSIDDEFEFEEEFDLSAEFESDEELSRFRRLPPRTRFNVPRVGAPRPIAPPRPGAPRPRPRPRWPKYPPPRIGRRTYLSAPDSSAASEYVRWVQTLLNQALNLQLPIDGVMSVQTRSAIRSFQEKNGLPVTGIVGPDTERVLQSPGGQTTEPAPASPSEEAEWEGEVNRSSRDYIMWVQQSLNRIMGLRLAVDGISGTQTRSAVRSFQQQRGLAVDGIVGPQTEQALSAAGAGNPPGSGGAPSVTPPPASTASRVRLAQQILNHPPITLWAYSPTDSSSSDGADALSNIRDTAAGRAAKRSSYGNAPGGSVYLDTRMLDGLLKLARVYRLQITSIAGGSHSSTSRHYAGIALDINYINGVHVTSSNPHYQALMQLCRTLGATEVLGPGYPGHDTHVHCAWPRP
ncbi:MAG: peptidoglycan-binding protein [Chloroflexi bacterium]|nr:peptidoglycan-binding protein [Chloroflexota bacterium]